MFCKASLLTTVLMFFSPWSMPLRATPSQDLEAKLGKRLQEYDLGTVNFVEALVRVSSDFQIPMGIAWINSPKENENAPFAWKQSTVREIIESIVSSESSYKVQFRNGVIRVFPDRMIPDAQNLLCLKIKQFDVVDGNIDLALLKLHGLISPFKQAGVSVGAEPNQPKITLRLKDSTVADILDAMALASSRRIWIVAFSSDSKPTVAGLRRTLVLWDGLSPVPEKNEPALNLLRWGDKIPWPTAAAK